ncbi:MAG: porin family protein [Bacteroidota bacterium]|nr:porin family protein [Bacteroidota bacterium]MDP4211063.1 porin family protein [Bacteroidota bacterium]MDP4249202.1 porin family protein [Bacteroidota bacterium]
MKKLFLLLLTGFSFAAADAQIQFGVKAGANMANFTGNDVSGTKWKIGFHGGALVAVPLFNEFSLQPEVVYSSQGTKVDQQDYTATMNSNYLNIPVLFKYNNPSGFFLETGPQLGFLMSAKAKSGSVSVDEKSAYKSTDFSWAFGLGYLISGLNAGIDARYNLGVSNIVKDSNNGTAKNSVFQLGIFYLFGQKAGNK